MKNDQLPSLKAAQNLLEGGTFVEIGTWDAGFSYELLKNTKCKKLFCVDPYKHFTDNSYQDGMNSLTQSEFDFKFNTVKNRLTREFGDRVEFLRMESLEASSLFEDNSLDFVYIDGNHGYPFVYQDIVTWYPKLKSGCYLTGDDVYSTNLNEHDSDGNVLRVWSTNQQGVPTCWGKYGTYKALVDAKEKLNFEFEINQTQFIVKK